MPLLPLHLSTASASVSAARPRAAHAAHAAHPSPRPPHPPLQANEIRSSVKYQLKKVLCLGVAVGNVAMTDRELYVNIQVRMLRCVCWCAGLAVGMVGRVACVPQGVD